MVNRRTFLIAAAGSWQRMLARPILYLDKPRRRRPEPSMVVWAQPVSRQARPLRRPEPR